MFTHFGRIAAALIVTFAVMLPFSRTFAALPSADDVVPVCNKVFSEVGLIVRSSGSSHGHRIGSLEKGAKVRLAGETEEGNGTVHPELAKQSDGSYWVKIKSPIPGWVLFAAQDDSTYRYLVPCN